jgi:hypothetical protein
VKNGHVIRRADRKRIPCDYGGVGTGHPNCPARAQYCEYMRWSCDPKGVSFFHYCAEHWVAMGPDGRSPKERAA